MIRFPLAQPVLNKRAEEAPFHGTPQRESRDGLCIIFSREVDYGVSLALVKTAPAPAVGLGPSDVLGLVELALPWWSVV